MKARWLLLLVTAVACDRALTSSPGASPTPPALPTTSASASTATGPDAAARIARWQGAYRSGPGSFFVPDASEWSGVKWRGDDAGTGLGEGTLELEIDGSGVVTGTASGALGDMRVTGNLVGEEISAAVRRKDPSDRGFTGTLLATRNGNAIEGKMRVSPGDAHAIREATFALSTVSH